MRTQMNLDQPQGEQPLHTFTWSQSEQPSSAVVVAIAEVIAEEPTDLDPLYTIIDPDALNRLFGPARSPRLNGSVSFEYHGYQVTVKADGRGFISEPDETRSPSSSLHSATGQTEGNL